MPDKAGFRVLDVTPSRPVCLAGYPGRKEPSAGVADPLFLRAVALEDAEGRRAVILTADLLKWPKDLTWRTKRWAEEALGLPSAALILNTSHSHSTPALFPQECYPQWGLDVDYVRELEVAIRNCIADALDDLRPMRIAYGLHRAEFGVNRRRPNPDRPGKVTLGVNEEGYFDPDLPILTFRRPDDDKLVALFYSYACHPTSRGGNVVSADWPGEVSRGLKARLGEDVVTLFAQGGGGSVMTRVRHKADGEDAYHDYFDAVAADIAAYVQSGEPREIRLNIEARENEFPVPFDMAMAPTHGELTLYADPAEPPIEKYIRPANRQILRLWAGQLLELERTRTLPEAYVMHATRLRLAEDLQIVATSGEVTAEMGRLVKDAEGEGTIFLGYCSYTDAYIPTAAMLDEEGHEALYSIYFHVRPAPFTQDIDDIVRRGIAATAF